MTFVSFYNFIDVLVVFLLIFFSLFLLCLRAGSVLSHRLLAAFMGCLALSYMDGVFLSFGYVFHYSYPHMVYLTMSFDYLIGPLLYLYVLSRTRPGFALSRRHLGHFAVFCLHFGFLFLRYHSKSLEVKRSILDSHQVFSHQEVLGLVVLSHAHYAFYTGLVLFTLFRYQQRIKQWYSSLQKANLRWLTIICVGLLLGGFMRLLNNLLWLHVPESVVLQVLDFKLFAIFSVLAFACIVFYKSLMQPEVLRMPIDPDKQGDGTGTAEMVETAPHPLPRVVTPVLPKDKRVAIQSALLINMDKARPYLDSDLSLQQLAADLGVKTHHLSQTINQECGCNFYDFINRYRLEACLEQLRDPGNQKYLTQIMYECGFNSKSVFNTLFKRVTGLTPSAYRKKSFAESSDCSRANSGAA